MYILLYSSPRPYGACSGGRGRAVMSAARVRPNDACAQCGLLILWRAPVILTASYPPPYCGQLDGATVVVHSPLLPSLPDSRSNRITHFRITLVVYLNDFLAHSFIQFLCILCRVPYAGCYVVVAVASAAAVLSAVDGDWMTGTRRCTLFSSLYAAADDLQSIV